MEESLMDFHRKTDFEKRLFLEREIKDLKEKYSVSNIKKEISKRDIEIGKLKSEIEELKHNKSDNSITNIYSKMTKAQKKNFKYKFKDELVEKQKRHIKILEKKITELKQQIK